MKLDEETIRPITIALYDREPFDYEVHGWALDALLKEAAKSIQRYQWLRSRDIDAVCDGGVFAGVTPDNVVLNGEDLDVAIDTAINVVKL